MTAAANSHSTALTIYGTEIYDQILIEEQQITTQLQHF